MREGLIEIVEEYEEGLLVKKTINGIPVSLNNQAIPSTVIHRQTMTREEYEKTFGKFPEDVPYLSNVLPKS